MYYATLASPRQVLEPRNVDRKVADHPDVSISVISTIVLGQRSYEEPRSTAHAEKYTKKTEGRDTGGLNNAATRLWWRWREAARPIWQVLSVLRTSWPSWREDTLSDLLLYLQHFSRCQVLGTAVAQWGRFARLDVAEERFKRYESLQARSCLSQSHLSFNPLANAV